MIEYVRMSRSIDCYYPADSGSEGPYYNIVDHDSTIKQIMISRQAKL
jgi:hypothetical protein